jgi:hypothetical protein
MNDLGKLAERQVPTVDDAGACAGSGRRCSADDQDLEQTEFGKRDGDAAVRPGICGQHPTTDQ